MRAPNQPVPFLTAIGMLPVNLLQLTDSRTLLSNAVGAVCFVAAYNVSKAFSRAAALSNEQHQNDADQVREDLLYAELQSTDRYSETLWNLRMSITREMRKRGQTVRTPPLRLLAQELQGDMPLYLDVQANAWTWLELFKLEPEMQALLQRVAAGKATTNPPSQIPPAPPRSTILWSRIPDSCSFKRVDEPGTPGLSSMVVQLPLGEYWALPAVLPFYGLGPRSAAKTVLTEHGWTRAGNTFVSQRPCVGDANGAGAEDAARQELSSLPPAITASPRDSTFPLFPPADERTSERRGFFKLTSLSPPPTLPRKRKAAADDVGPSKAARTDNASSLSIARSRLSSAPPVTPPSLPRCSSPPGAPRRRRQGPMSPLPMLQAEMRTLPFTWSPLSPHVPSSQRTQGILRP